VVGCAKSPDRVGGHGARARFCPRGEIEPRAFAHPTAYDVGFGDLSYFIRCFKRHYGATPGDLRQEAGK
jgi:hypothetical protein